MKNKVPKEEPERRNPQLLRGDTVDMKLLGVSNLNGLGPHRVDLFN